MFDAKIIAETDFNNSLFLAICAQAVGDSPAKPLDGSGKRVSDQAKTAYFLKGLRDGVVGFDRRDLAHSTVTVILIGDTYTLMDIWAICVGMKFQVAETKQRNLTLAIATGDLTQWQSAVSEGLKSDVNSEFTLLYQRFVEGGYSHVWDHYKRETITGNQLRLTYNP